MHVQPKNVRFSECKTPMGVALSMLDNFGHWTARLLNSWTFWNQVAWWGLPRKSNCRGVSILRYPPSPYCRQHMQSTEIFMASFPIGFSDVSPWFRTPCTLKKFIGRSYGVLEERTGPQFDIGRGDKNCLNLTSMLQEWYGWCSEIRLLPVEVGSFIPLFTGFLTSQVVMAGFLNHQQYSQAVW